MKSYLYVHFVEVCCQISTSRCYQIAFHTFSQRCSGIKPTLDNKANRPPGGLAWPWATVESSGRINAIYTVLARKWDSDMVVVLALLLKRRRGGGNQLENVVAFRALSSLPTMTINNHIEVNKKEENRYCSRLCTYTYKRQLKLIWKKHLSQIIALHVFASLAVTSAFSYYKKKYSITNLKQNR